MVQTSKVGDAVCHNTIIVFLRGMANLLCL